MQRKKLQALVRQSLVQEQQIATEGFLGDSIDAVKKFFSMSPSLLTKEEVKKERVLFHKIADRLKATVLNDRWLEEAELATSPITAQWAVPGLDYKGQFSETDPLKHLKQAIADTTKTVGVYSGIISKHSVAYQKIYRKLIADVVKAKDDEQAQENALDASDKAFDALTPVKQSLQQYPVDMLGNIHVTVKNGKLDKSVSATKVTAVQPLTKVQMKELASLLLKLVEADLDGKIFQSGDYIDWDGLIHDVKDEADGYDDAEKYMDVIGRSKIARNGYDQNAFDDSGITTVLSAIDLLYIRPLLWMNASIK